MEFEALFNGTQTRNDKNNITGVLVQKDKFFFQILEGKAEVVDSLFETIKQDSRHSNITELLNKTITHISFSAFNTGYSVIADIDSLYSLQNYVMDLNEKDIENSGHFLEIIEDLLRLGK